VKRYLVGLGNWTMGDDSIGLRVVEEIVARKLEKGFEAVSLFESGINLIQYFEAETERIVMIDTVRAGREPGEFFLFHPGDVASHKDLGNVSTHEGDILKVIEFARQLKYPIPPITIMGIEPLNVGPGDLSDLLRSKMESYLTAAVASLA
jgi:hydrogenase maturation protease